MNIEGLPDDVLLEIFSRVPGLDIIRRCRLVCRRWRDICDSPSLWTGICQQEGFLPKKWNHPPKDWKKYYYICKSRKNLLKNPSAEQDFESWKIEANGGDRWRVEELPGEHGQILPDIEVGKYFVTSYNLCLKSQLIDLKAQGYSQKLLDQDQPKIVIRDCYAARQDCGCRYQALVKLLTKQKKTVKTFSPKPVVIPQWSDGRWEEMTHTFTNYGPGVRYVYFRHGGQDTQFWAGWYGIRVTNSRITVEPEDLS